MYRIITVFLLLTASLYSHNDAQTFTTSEQTFALEQSGNFSAALNSARQSLAQAANDDEFHYWSGNVSRLENLVLQKGLSLRLFDEHYSPRPQLMELFHLLGMPQNCLDITSINEWAQKNLLRTGERWQMQPGKYEYLREKIISLVADLGFLDRVESSFDLYDGALVHGALLMRVRSRLNCLVEQWKKGIRFTELYFLTGERPLDPIFECPLQLYHDELSPLKIRKDWTPPENPPQYESEMVMMVWEQSEIPEDMRQAVSVHLVNAPQKFDAISDKWLRPNTEDTVKEWVKESPACGRYLAVTEAPYIGRQDYVVRMYLPSCIGLDTIGNEIKEEKRSMTIILDELARWIYCYSTAPLFVN